jgi:hypothetical protein
MHLADGDTISVQGALRKLYETLKQATAGNDRRPRVGYKGDLERSSF